MASYTTGKVGGAAAAGRESLGSTAPAAPSKAGGLGERMAKLAGAGCLGTTPVRYHAIRFSIVVGVPIVAALASGASVGPELVAKVVVWFVLTEVAGFGGADGQLGDGHTLLTPLWFRLTPGTLRQTPFDDPATPLGGRGPLDAVLLISTLIAALGALVTTGSTHVGALRIFALAFTCLSIRDYSAWCGGQGKHFYPLLLIAAVCARGDGLLPAMQATQFAHIFFSGLCKCGPWFVNVVPTMCGMSPFLPASVRALVFVDSKGGDARPSGAAMVLAAAGVVVEVGGPLLWLLGGCGLLGGAIASQLGVAAVGAMHLYIILANPLGGIGEWNAANIFLEWYLFARHTYSPLAFVSEPPLALVAFLVASQYAAPILGNLRPDAMSYLLAIRNYSGNHATHIFAARTSALHKLNRVPGAFALLDSPSAPADDPAVNPHGRPPSTPPHFAIDGLLGGLGTLARARGNTKCLGWLLERFVLPAGDGAGYAIISLPQFCNQTVTEIDFGSPGLLRALAKTAGLQPGDLLSLRISSYPFLPCLSTRRYRCHWSVVDAADALAADPAAPAPPLPAGAPSRWGLFGRTTASLLWDLAGEKKGVIECAPLSGFFEGSASAWQWGHEGEAKTFDAQGCEVTAARTKTD